MFETGNVAPTTWFKSIMANLFFDMIYSVVAGND